MQLETVIYEKKEGMIIISLNRPRVLNAINGQLTDDFLTALRAAEADAEAKVVILRGEGRAFAPGLISHSLESLRHNECLLNIGRMLCRR